MAKYTLVKYAPGFVSNDPEWYTEHACNCLDDVFEVGWVRNHIDTRVAGENIQIEIASPGWFSQTSSQRVE